MKRSWCALAVAALTFAVAACGGSDSDSSSSGSSGSSSSSAKTTEPIVIGAAIAKTGTFSQYDIPAYNFFKLKVDEINSAGGINGRKIKLVESDARSDPAQAKVAGERVLAQGADILLAVCDFDFGSPAALAAEKAGKVSFTLCAQSPKWGVQGIGPLSYTQSIATFSEGSVMARFADKKGYGNGFVLVDDTISYDREQCDGFKQTYKGKIVGEERFKNGDSSIASQITKIKAANPDFVVMCTYPPGGPTALRQIRAAGIDIPIISGLAMEGTYWTKSVPKIGEYYVSSPVSINGDDPNAKVNEIVEKYAETYGEKPAVGLALAGYSVAEALEKALKETGGDPDGKKLADALNKFNKVPLLAGETTFTPELHVNKDRSMAILQYVDNKPKYVDQVEADPAVELRMSS
jgi:branched-chain amino acid transport system substrate-binding protein